MEGEQGYLYIRPPTQNSVSKTRTLQPCARTLFALVD